MCQQHFSYIYLFVAAFIYFLLMKNCSSVLYAPVHSCASFILAQTSLILIVSFSSLNVGVPTPRWSQSRFYWVRRLIHFLQKRTWPEYCLCYCFIQHRRGTIHKATLLFKAAPSNNHQGFRKQIWLCFLFSIPNQPITSHYKY